MKTLLGFVIFVTRQLWKHIRCLRRFSISFPASSQKQSSVVQRRQGYNTNDVVKLSKPVQLYGMLHEGEAPEVCSHPVLQGS